MTETMKLALAITRANGGILRKIPGGQNGYWVYPGFKLRAGSKPHPAIYDKTIRSLVREQMLEYVTPREVRAVSALRRRPATGSRSSR